MAKYATGLRHRLIQWRATRHWTKLARLAKGADLASLRVMRSGARHLRARLDQVIRVADSRLALPLIGSNAFAKPLYSDWSYRPELWREPIAPIGIAAAPSKSSFGDEVMLFHDCRNSELTMRQVRNTRESDLAPFGLRMDVFRFDGSFLSLVIEMPQSAVEGLKRRHLVRMNAVVEMEKPLEVFARLNIKHGPNTEQLVRELPFGDLDETDRAEVEIEFDLAYTNMNEKRVERMWIDLVIENPEMSQIVLRDLTFSRRPRAEV
ncbi:hypothetical protein XMM379_002292 [Aliiroseovarius sp. xm-m-379]|uniref:Uncharacterized protein n=1 Tax=Aliiroseovarius crassostreae TaxID=154981 RepID=A0A9Q9HBN9_9RHOB|nr:MULTISPECIES: DUF6478 family protein [Aliiroseovarius]NRP13762.1 hypothetical protein [Aliiroseovarius sp. xm-d-517]NRP25594.1 hypothetical protein [Aliiroseovarius sp. xm-m-379]NRP29587.1 hypothetical protein [Aliiroseovarius sp. xm-m-314]NRP34393.1 hypothetical protein [Aliiroseovarius sp. xm-a-104]NRP41649.1 hypothetical protein [Aliiroseovarius sp. xm-m-339-2]